MSLRRRFRILNWKLKRRLARFESRAVDLLYGRAKAQGKLGILAFFLNGFELIFRQMVRLRLHLYQSRVLKQEYLGCLVVVIGNLTVGGTGKTPVVEKFARELISRGRKVAILSRGYKRRESSLLRKLIGLIDPEIGQPTVVSDGKNILCDWHKAGDEPYMLAQNLPGAIVIVDKNRVKAGIFAIRKFGADTLLLDDGFQYLPLKSRQQLLLVDQSNPFGNGKLLPRGILREPIEALRRATTLFITKSDGHPPEALLATLREYAPHCAPIVCAHTPKSLKQLENPLNVLPLSDLTGKRVFAFSGIAVPESFERQLTDCGATIVKAMRFLDHYDYEPEDIEQIVNTAASMGVDYIVTTEKDAVRLPPMGPKTYFLRMEVEILSGAENFTAAVDTVCFPPEPMKTRPFV